MKLKPTTLIAGVVLIAIGGFVAGRISSSRTASGERAAAVETKAEGSTGRGGEGGGAEKRHPRTERPDEAAKTLESRLAKLGEIMRGEDPLARSRALLDFIDRLGPNDFENVLARFDDLGITKDRMGEYSMLLTAWAHADPAAALKYSEDNASDSFAQETILTAWVATDPEAAIRWAQAAHEGDGANPFLPGVIRGLFQSDPARATELLSGMPRSEERGKGLEFILPHLLEQGPDATRAWIASLTDDALKNGAIMRSANELAAVDPAGTAAWLLANPGEAAKRRMDDVYGSWVSKDPDAAVASFNSLPAGGTRSDALRGLVRSVAVSDPKAALSMMDRYPTNVTDDVVQNFVWHAIGKDPGTALAQIPRIADERQREQTYRRTLDVWLERDPASAQAWLRMNPIPDSVRERIARRQTTPQ